MFGKNKKQPAKPDVPKDIQRTQKEDGSIVEQLYVSNGQLLTIETKPDGTKITELSDEKSRLVTIENPDGTTEKFTEFFYGNGSIIMEDTENGGNIKKQYDAYGNLVMTLESAPGWMRNRKLDEDGRIIEENEVNHENHEKVTASVKKKYAYHHNDNISQVDYSFRPEGTKVTMRFDADGNFIEKFEKKAAVTTWFDETDKPIRRQIDKGQGYIVTEELN
ncbi:MAG: hypothetical protein LBJ74_04170 [Heliobacteriaceae bacterium]|jgi:uncharacterized protein RhaS with RHS repeats|nr:hypothetical protein [Heliobacteriaceae bacterium]